MKNKKGFTLIELLAVIVVLAIIALIATPIVMNTIKNAKKGAAARSADNYIKQVETAVAESRIDGTKIANGTYNIQPDGNLCPASGCGENDKNKITIDMSGTKPTSGTVTISNGEVSQNETKLVVGDYNVKYNQENNKYEATEKENSSTLCKAVTTATLGNIPQGQFTYGDEYICDVGDGEEKTFYVLETNGDNVSLIMKANVGKDGKMVTTVSSNYDQSGAWSADNKNHIDEDESAQAVTVKNKLAHSTAYWDKITDKTKITLPTAEQIFKASGKTFNGSEDDNLSTWLCDTIFGTGNDRKRAFGYWTSTPGDNNKAFYIYSNGLPQCTLSSTSTLTYVVGNDSAQIYGIRPVITISKSQLG